MTIRSRKTASRRTGGRRRRERPEDAPKVDGLPLGEAEVQRVTLPPELPVLPVRGLVLFPQVVLPIAVNEERDLRLVNDVVVGNRLMVVVAVEEREGRESRPGRPLPGRLRRLRPEDDEVPGRHHAHPRAGSRRASTSTSSPPSLPT